MALPIAVGASLGISLGLFGQTFVSKYLQNDPPKQEKTAPTVDPRFIEEIIDQKLKMNQLETQLNNLRQDIAERELLLTQTAQPVVKSNVDVIELSQVLEANNIAHNNKSKRDLENQRRNLLREHTLKLESEIIKVENRYKPVINKIKELELHLETQQEIFRKEAPARLLWISCQALLDTMRYAPQAPLKNDPAYDVLKQFAANNNPLAISIVDSIPAKALTEGIQSEESLIDRFSKVEKICRRVALVSESGGGITKYLVSYLQSLFIIDNVNVPEDEITGKQLVDPTSWHTFDILARVKYCLSRHNLEQAIRYANQLRGQARVVARDWICDARLHLETRQAFSALSTHAEAIAVDAVRQTFAK